MLPKYKNDDDDRYDVDEDDCDKYVMIVVVSS